MGNKGKHTGRPVLVGGRLGLSALAQDIRAIAACLQHGCLVQFQPC